MNKTDKPVQTPADDYRGVDINKGDSDKVDKELVRQDTRQLNNNPRNGDMEVQHKG